MVSLNEHLLHYTHELFSLKFHTTIYYVVCGLDLSFVQVDDSFCGRHILRLLFFELGVPRDGVSVVFVVYHSFATCVPDLWPSLKLLDFRPQFQSLLWKMLDARS